jgi:ADP-heptose:LPS heptosyltransferase
LRRERYDLAIDPCAASQSGRLLLAAARARHAIGVALAKPGATAAAVRRDTNTPTHMAQLPVFLLRNAVSPPGLESIVEYLEYPRLALGLSDSERQVALATLDAMTHGGGPSRPRATIGIFASATGSKRHDPAWWLRFMAEIRAQQTDYAIVELGSEHGQTQLAAELPSFSSKRIREVAAFISNLTCFISADCGVMHLAAASGVMTIGLFSTSDPAVYAPYGNGSRAIVTTGRNPQDVARDVVGAVEEKISHDVIRTSLAAGAQRRLPAAATP